MPPKVVTEPESPPPLPPALASQVELIRAQVEPPGAANGAVLLRYVDAGLLNISEIAEVSFELLNRVLALRTVAEQLAQAMDAARWPGDPDLAPPRDRALQELEALESVLGEAGPSATTRAMGYGW